MKALDKLLTQQAWELQVNLEQRLETEHFKIVGNHSALLRMERLNTIKGRAYSRYLRRLNRLWR